MNFPEPSRLKVVNAAAGGPEYVSSTVVTRRVIAEYATPPTIVELRVDRVGVGAALEPPWRLEPPP